MMEPARRSSRTPIPKVPLDYDEPYRKPAPLSKKKPLLPKEAATAVATRPGPASKKTKLGASSEDMQPEEAASPEQNSPEKPKSPMKNKPGPASKKNLDVEPETESAAEATSKRKLEEVPEKENKKIKVEPGVAEPAEEPVTMEITVSSSQPVVCTQSPMRSATLPAGMDADFVTDRNKMTEAACGYCEFCNRKPCRECSHCKRGDPDNCIDKYCMNNRENVDSRVAMRELYLQMLKNKAAQRDQELRFETSNKPQVKQQGKPKIEPDGQQGSQNSPVRANTLKPKTADASGSVVELKGHMSENVVFVVEDSADIAPEVQEGDDDVGLSTQEKIEKIMSAITHHSKRKSVEQRTPRKRSSSYVYGSSASARKLRRCGECEGCMMEDCGKCEICLDKPKFGGPGRLKKACSLRKCIMAGASAKRR